VRIGWAADGHPFFVAVEEYITCPHKEFKGDLKQMSDRITLILNKLTPVVIFPERFKHWLVRMSVMVSYETPQVLGSFRAVVCGSRIRSERYGAREEKTNDQDPHGWQWKSGVDVQNGIFGKNCHRRCVRRRILVFERVKPNKLRT